MRAFGRNESGSIALIIGLGAPVLCGFVGVAVDYAMWTRQTAMLQAAADVAALAAAKEMQLGSFSETRLNTIVAGIVNAQVPLKQGDGPITIETKPLKDTSNQLVGARVSLYQRKNAIMSRLVTPELTDVNVVAVANCSGVKTCVVGLEASAADTIRLDNDAKISASDCAVYANSVSSSAIRAESNSKIVSKLTCSAGGYAGMGINYAPELPMTDCPKVADPLSERPPPSVGPCPKKPVKIKKKSATLDPGVYCGGLYLENGADITLRPGVYVIQDGPLIIGPGKPGAKGGDKGQTKDDDGTPASRGSVKGTGVSFFFTGTLDPNDEGQLIGMRFEPNSVVEITAPTSGTMAGLLFYEGRGASLDRRYEVLSDSARRLVGTVYIPRGIFSVSANQIVADQSEYTAVVARRIELFQAPNLVLNTRYADTDVPVPRGLGNGAITLVK